MNYTGQNKLELLHITRKSSIKNLLGKTPLTKRLAALLYALEGRTVDCVAIRQCLVLIKQNTGAFSNFQGKMALGVAALLSLSPNPQEVFSEILKVYDLLKGVKRYRLSCACRLSDCGTI